VVRLSYASGAVAPLLEKTLSQALRDAAAKFPDGEALVVSQQKIRLTWREMDAEVTRVARGLAGLGLRPGDRAGIWASNCAEWVLLQYAAGRCGVELVNVNPAYRSHELRYVLRKSRIRALFLHEKDARASYRDILEESRAGEKLELEYVVWLGTETWDAMLAGGIDFDERSGPHDVANIQYTSGTTGSPKGVLLTHYNLLNNGAGMAMGMRATERDRICAPVPLYHCFGSVIGSMVSVTSCATLILPSPQFDVLATLEAVHKERATALYGVPTMFIAQLTHPEFERFDLTSLRTGVMAGAPCPIETMRRVVERMHIPELTIVYGQTETSPGLTMSDAGDALELRVTTVGKALPNTEIRIVNPTTNETVPVGETGELCARGYMIMKGYDQDKEATEAVIDSEGWLHTGDLAAMRPDHYFSFKGRAKDTIIRGGENIYPREVEDFLHTHPAIADVYVIGLPDAKLGETVVAWVQLAPGATATEDEIRNFCRSKIAYFKIPQFIRFVDGFPMTVTKKVQKYLMREQEIRERGLEAVASQATA
jgi:fatty-acyl-CoA synthase